ncbi:MAG: DNA polymerase III subunit delta [Bdellovibrionales bacterium]|nr:DNA polymerase III subunit delta [Bdellovibrionales bacterium]
MAVTASRIFKDLSIGKWSPLNLVVGEEPFQTREIIERFKSQILRDSSEIEFNLESFDGVNSDYGQLLESLQQMPGLFAETPGIRLVICRDLDRLGEAALEKMSGYFSEPSESTCFVATASKVKKKSAWYMAWSQFGNVVEVHEPFERDWVKWKAYFENKCRKKIEPEAWNLLLDVASRRLSVLWMEIDKISTFVEPRSEITLRDVLQDGEGKSTESIFSFGEAVLRGNQYEAIKQYRALIASGENEIKILSLVVKQFRLLYQCMKMKEQGEFDLASAAKLLGAHPYFLTKLLNQADTRAKRDLKWALNLLAECDFSLKLGRGSFLDNFCIPYFSESRCFKVV